MSKRSLNFRRVAATIAAASLFFAAACSSDAETKSNTADAGNSTLVFAINVDPPNLNPILATAPSTMSVANVWVEGLWYMNTKLEPVPKLAKSWEIQDEGKTITLKLREGVKWHDGQPFTADDVVFTLTEMSKFSARAGSFVKILDSVTASDPNTVVIKMKKAYGPIFTVLDERILPIVPKHLLADGDVTKSDFNTQPIGTGPFKISEWQHGQTITAVANKDYWQKGSPSIQKVVFKIIPDEASITNAMRAGEIDAIGNAILNGNTAKTLEAAGLAVTKIPGTPSIKFVLPNVKHPALSNPKVRQAVYTAIDRKSIIEAAYEGYADPARGMIPDEYKSLRDNSTDYDQVFAYSPENAAKMLDEAGFPAKNGVRFKLNLSYSPSSHGSEGVVQILKANLASVGITVNLQSLDNPTLLDKVYKNRDFDLAHLGSSTYGDPNLGIDRTYTCDESGKAYQNPTNYCNPELDALLAAAASEVEASKRQELYVKAQAIVTRDLPVFPLASLPKFEATSKRLSNLEAEFDYFGAGDPTWAFAKLK